MSQNNHEIILCARDLRLSYRTRYGFLKWFEHDALNGISIDLRKGETLGVLGRNGSGKSSLLRLLAGLIDPTSGQIDCDKSVRRALLALGLGFRNDLSGRDNALISSMLQGTLKKEALAALPGIREFSELGAFFDQPVKTYSTGMRARLCFSTALLTNVDVLFIDEVLGVGDAHFRKKAENALREKICGEQTVVFVSHSEKEIEKICDRALWLADGVVRELGDAVRVAENYGKFE